MLKVPELDDLTYEQIIQQAVSKIPSRTEEWTDYNHHDPGITVLEMYAWLTEMLNYYMNATGDIHVEKYLKLLGVEPEEGRPAGGYLMVEQLPEKTFLPKGTCFMAGTVPFETVEDYQVYENHFCAFFSESDGMLTDLTAFAGQDGDYAEAFAENSGKEAAVWFFFEKPLKAGDRLYICVEPDERRNPFDDSFRLGKLSWQIYTVHGWTEISAEDGTCGFLRSGLVKPEISEEMTPYQESSSGRSGYVIRAVLKESQYDSSPRIGMVYVNPLEVVQKRTVCKEGDLLPELCVGRTDGCAGQELLFDYPDVWKFSLLLCTKNGERTLWKQVPSFAGADYDSQVFTYDRVQKKIRFGDGIHGCVPEQKQEIYVTGLTCSLYEAGNVQAGELRFYERMPETEGRIYNPLPLGGGRNQEQLKDMTARMEETVFAQKRMASAKDYETIIGSTPGLRIECVHVIPGIRYGQLYGQRRSRNEVVAVVKPWSKDVRPALSEAYQNAICHYMEPFRLLNTKVSIVSPAYVGIEIYGRLILKTKSQKEKEQVTAWLTDQIEGSGEMRKFGTVISRGKLFHGLELLDGVSRVQELHLERIGNAAEKDDRGDLHLQEDALCYLEKIELEFV